MASKSTKWLFLLLPLLIVLLFWMAMRNRMDADFSDYQGFYRVVARNLVAGHGFVDATGAPGTRYPPGYPTILAAAFKFGGPLGLSERSANGIINILGFCIACALLYFLAAAIWGPRRALLAWIVAATYPLGLFLTTYPSPEVPFLVLLLGAILAYVHGLQRSEQAAVRLMLLSGLLIGAAMLVRPIAIGVGVLLAALAWWLAPQESRRVRVTLIAAVLAGNAIVAMPWEAWALARTGHVIMLSTGGVPSMRDGLTFGVPMKGKRFRRGIRLPSGVKAVMRTVRESYPTLNTPGDIARLMVQQAKEHPAAVVELGVIKAARAWYGTDSQRMELPILALQLVYLLACLAAMRAAWKCGGDARRLAVVVAGMVLGFWLIVVLALPVVRYTVPSMMLMFTLLPALLKPEPAATTTEPAEPATAAATR